jgi:Meiotically Up-regulated Gene 113 (MUG113) protein
LCIAWEAALEMLLECADGRLRGQDMAGIVYVLTNAVMPGLVKIGITDDNVESRIKSLDNTSVPIPFECFYAAQVADPARVEKAIHEAFGDNRIRKSREFFRISPDKPKAVIELLCLKNVTPGQEVVADAEDQDALNEERKRRSNFRFSLIGIKPGTELQSVFDDSITCTVKSDRWVDFRGTEHSLSSSALEIAHEKGLG